MVLNPVLNHKYIHFINTVFSLIKLTTETLSVKIRPQMLTTAFNTALLNSSTRL